MNDQPQQPVAFPWMPIQMWQQPQQPQGFQLGNEVPARVAFALRALDFFATKERDCVAVNNVGFESFPGQKLSHAEVNARESAANLLNVYFMGKVDPDQWEDALLNRSDPALEDRKGVTMLCPNCRPHEPLSSCAYCGGCGRVTVTACPQL